MKIKLIAAASALTIGTLGLSTTASAAGPVITGGLVNVTVTDVIGDVTVVVQDINVSVGAALQLAANLCDVNVNVLATQLRDGGAACDNAVDGTTTITQV